MALPGSAGSKYALEACLPGISQGCEKGVWHAMQVGLRNDLPIAAPVDNAGVFTEEAGPFQGELIPQLHQFSACVVLPKSLLSCRNGCKG